MEKLVEVVMRNERDSDLLDRVVLAVGVLSLCLALAGTLIDAGKDLANDARPATVASAV